MVNFTGPDRRERRASAGHLLGRKPHFLGLAWPSLQGVRLVFNGNPNAVPNYRLRIVGECLFGFMGEWTKNIGMMERGAHGAFAQRDGYLLHRKWCVVCLVSAERLPAPYRAEIQ